MIGLSYFQLLLLLLLFLAALADIRTDRIPNGLIILGIVAGISYNVSVCRNLWQSAVSMVLAFLLMYPLFKIGAFGAGDVKVLMMAGSFLAIQEFLAVLTAAFAAGACLSILKILTERNGRERASYFLAYIWEVAKTGQWRLYGEYTAEDMKQYRRNKIHFTIPVLLGAVLQIGGVI